MTAEQKAALILARVAVLNAWVAAMVAENQLRLHRDETPAYDEDAFAAVIAEANLSEDSVLKGFQQ